MLSQEKLEKIVEKKLDLHELADSAETNKFVKEITDNSELMDALDDISPDDMLESFNLDNVLYAPRILRFIFPRSFV